MARFPRFKPGQTFGLRGPGGTLILDRNAAEILNLAAREMTRLGNLSVQAPLRLSDTDAGRLLALDRMPRIWVKLSGAGNPYSFVQQQYDPGTNTWSDMAGGRTGTSNCYESKGKSGLAGKVVPITWTAAGDWRFQFIGYTCTCVSDASFICICSCCTPYARTASIGDDVGTHAMTYQSLGGSIFGWRGSATLTGVDTYTGGGLGCTLSPPPFTELPYTYELRFDCTAMLWTLFVRFGIVVCNSGGPNFSRYATPGGGLATSVSATAALDCSNTSLLTFNIPTTVPDGTLDTPGGGGTLSIAF